MRLQKIPVFFDFEFLIPADRLQDVSITHRSLGMRDLVLPYNLDLNQIENGWPN